MAQGGMCEKMNFTYTYRSSDGERHTAEIEAESRDAAFAKIRTELGIKPIKVVAEEDGSGKSAASERAHDPPPARVGVSNGLGRRMGGGSAQTTSSRSAGGW